MRHILQILFVFSLAALTGCAVGPLVNHETARTVGEQHVELAGGYGNAGYVIKGNFGLLEKWDLGFQLESLSIGIRTKYSFIKNDEKGFSLAGAAGIGSSVGGNHYYGDLIASYFSNDMWEPYTTLRIVHVKTDPIEFRDEDTGGFDMTISSYNYDYGQFILGTRLWFTPKWMMSIEGSTLFQISGVDFKSGFIVSVAGGYRF